MSGTGTTTTTFSLAPGLMSATPFDFSSSNDTKIYNLGASKLPSAFDLDQGKLKLFLTDLGSRSGAMGWASILTIPVTQIGTTTASDKNMLTEYGQMTLKDVTDQAATYMGSSTRNAQYQMQLYLCLSVLLSETARVQLSLRESEYKIGADMSGTAFLKVIIGESLLDTNATTKHIRDNLNALNEYIVSIDSDIVKFNIYVKLQLDGLAARGETTHDLLNNLFKAYKAASDKKFVEYIERKEIDYEDGDKLEARELMNYAKKRYLSKKENGNWNAASEDEAKIIALQTQVDILEGKASLKAKTDTPTHKPKGKDKKFQKPAWMLKVPDEGDAKSKKVDGKDYHWCPTHVAWVRHRPDQCEGKGFKPPKKPEGAEPVDKMKAALANSAEVDSEDEE